MNAIINKLFPFTSMKVALIRAILRCCSVQCKAIIIGRVLATDLPEYHIHKNPKRGK
jgi:hypothetical protein